MYRKKAAFKPPDAVLSSYRSFLRRSRIDSDGNSFTESTFTARRSNWATHNQISLVRPWDMLDEPREGNSGAYSLLFYARKALNKYVGELTVEVLQHTPWSFAERIWMDACATGRDSFKVWATFAAVYPEHIGVRTRNIQVPNTEPLVSVIDTLADSAFAGIVYLDLSMARGVTHGSLLKTLEVSNLHTLILDGNTGAANDSIIRSWGRSGRMTKLEQLSLRDCEGITKSTLQYASWLPRLMYLDLTGCSLALQSTWINDAKENGWLYIPSTLLETLEDVQAEDLVLRVGISFGITQARSHKPGKRFVRNEADLKKVAKKPNPSQLVERQAKTGGPAKLKAKRKMDIGSLLDEFTMRGPPKRR